MNEDGSRQCSGNDVSAEVEHGPPLDSDSANEVPGKFIENSAKSAASELIYGRSSRMQSKLSEMHNDPIRHLPYGLWMSSEGTVMGNVDRRSQGPSHESSVHWPSLLPVSGVATVAPTDRNIPFECSQKVPNCSMDASSFSRNSNTERIANSESDLVTKWKDTVDFRPGREQEQFNLWKIASLIRGISPSDKGERKELDVRDKAFSHGSLMDDGKVTERSWAFGCNEHNMKMKSLSASSALSYPVTGSESRKSDLDLSSRSQLLGQPRDNTVVRNRGESPGDDQPAFIPSLRTVEQLPGRKSSDVLVRMKLSHPQSSSQLPESPTNQHEAKTRDVETRETSLQHSDAVKGIMSVVDISHAAKSTGDKQISVGSGRSLLHDDVTSGYAGASQLATLPAESASSGLTGHDKSPASSASVSGSPNNGISLYRRRVQSLLLKQGNSLTEGFQAELPRSPRIQNRFDTAFEQDDSSSEVAVADNVCGNFHKEKCFQEHGDERNNRTLTESDYTTEHVASTGCLSSRPLEQEKISRSDKLSGTSCGVVNYAIVSSEVMDEHYRPRVSAIDCSYTGQMVKDGMKSGCVEKGLQVGGPCCHSGYGTVAHSVCQCCTDISAHHLSPSCHLPIKVSPAAVCGDVAAKCCMAHRLGALPTPTRACAAALCQLSCSGIPSHSGSPKGVDMSSGCQFSRPKSGSQCNTPCHQAMVKCACARDGCLAPVHQSGCPYTVSKSSVRGCSARIFHQDHAQQPGDTQPHTPCMAHTPYTPREAYTPREPDTPQDSNGICEPCTPQNLCSHRARKYPHTPTAACYFQFPPLLASKLDCSSSGVCQSPCVSYTRCLPPCHTPCMSPLNLTIGQPCVAHTCTPQCCFQHQKLTTSASCHRHSCVC